MALTDYFTPTWLKAKFLLGLPLRDASGTAFPDSFYELPISAAIDKVGEDLDLTLEETDYTEEPYNTTGNLSTVPNYAPISLVHRPVQEITQIRAKFGNNALFDIPTTWYIRNIGTGTDYDYVGQVSLIPTTDSINVISLFLGFPFSFADVQPMLFRVTYTAGYAEGADVPPALQVLIGLQASLQVLELMGAFIGGVGVQSRSVGLDGLNTSRGSTKTATSGALGGLTTRYSEMYEKGVASAKKKYDPPVMFAL